MRRFWNSFLISGFIGAASMAQATTFAPSSFSVRAGSSAGAVQALAQAGEGSVLRLYTDNAGNLRALFQIPVASSQGALSLRGSLKQNTPSDVFRFQVRDASGLWRQIGAASGSASVESLHFALPSGVVVNGSVIVRIISSSGADDLALDQLVLVDGAGAATPTPTPTSTPTPAPKATPTPSPTPVSAPVSSANGAIPVGTKWYWQLQGTVNTTRAARVYDIDLFDNSASLFASLKASGHTVICYFSAGTYEPGRPDSSQFPTVALGSGVQGWPGEKWLDVRNSTVRQIMMARMDLAKSKGCDGLEPDNVDGYANGNGFGLTKTDQVDFDTFLADQAHQRGMIVALKNTTDLVSTLVSKFDFAVVEECFKYNECPSYSPFVTQGKAVLNAEYTSYSATTCSQAAKLGFSTVFYNLNLDGSVYNPCP